MRVSLSELRSLEEPRLHLGVVSGADIGRCKGYIEQPRQCGGAPSGLAQSLPRLYNSECQSRQARPGQAYELELRGGTLAIRLDSTPMVTSNWVRVRVRVG